MTTTARKWDASPTHSFYIVDNRVISIRHDLNKMVVVSIECEMSQIEISRYNFIPKKKRKEAAEEETDIFVEFDGGIVGSGYPLRTRDTPM